ncbi:MAG TPA: hypothetical protein DCM68_00300 [Verrucomicrobia bacterium]|nr:hypothetical protein [Verrucomicrobiota bacterium]
MTLALAGPGCAHAGKTPAKDSPAKKAAGAPPAAKKKVAKKPAPQQTAKKTPPAKKKAKSAAAGPLKLDPDNVLVRKLQSKELKAQRGKKESFIQRQNRFTRWVDDAHDRCYRWMDNAVRRVDTRWLAEDAPYDPELSTFKLRIMAREGGRSREKDFDFKVRFRADMAMPGLERKLHLYLDNAGRDELPGLDPMKQESDTRLGLRTMLRTVHDSQLEVGGGLRWREANPVVYTALEWRWQREDESGGRLCLNPRGVYYSDEGFGQQITLSWTKPVGERKLFQIRTAERSSEGLDGVEFEQSFRFAWLRSGRGRGWVAQASVFPHLTSSDWVWDDSLLNITWRDALYRKWIYYTITPQIQFPKEDRYQARPSIRIGLEILFGGKIGDLM